MESRSQVRNVAVLLAGGVGTRVGLDIPKQLIKVAGKTILEHTLMALHDHPLVDEVLIMMTPGHLDAVRAIVRTAATTKVTDILEGGETRNETTLRALERLGDDECHVLLHDAVRPLVTPRIIDGVLRRAADVPRRRRGDPVGGHHRRGRRRRHHHRRSRPGRRCAAARPRRRFRSSVIKRAYALAERGPRLRRHRRLHGGAALPPRRADLGGARRRAEHEGHRADRRLPRRQALPAAPAPTSRRRRPPRRTTARR